MPQAEPLAVFYLGSEFRLPEQHEEGGKVAFRVIVDLITDVAGLNGLLQPLPVGFLIGLLRLLPAEEGLFRRGLEYFPVYPVEEGLKTLVEQLSTY